MSSSDNPYYDLYRSMIIPTTSRAASAASLKDDKEKEGCDEENGKDDDVVVSMEEVFNPKLNDGIRNQMLSNFDIKLTEKYAWAIPDERALEILTFYSPIVEMGAGRGYWARLLRNRGVDIICYDLHLPGEKEEEKIIQVEENKITKNEKMTSDDECSNTETEEKNFNNDSEDGENKVEMLYNNWTQVLKGTPKELVNHSDRALLLCYPDDFDESDDSMALECLEKYTGDTVLHIGELFGHTLCLPDPWGRTSAPEFQVRLAAVYHKVLQVPLPSWHSSMDTLSVWKRTQTCILEDDIYAYIPAAERLDLVMTCPSTQHLVENCSKSEKNGNTNKKRKGAFLQNSVTSTEELGHPK